MSQKVDRKITDQIKAHPLQMSYIKIFGWLSFPDQYQRNKQILPPNWKKMYEILILLRNY